MNKNLTIITLAVVAAIFFGKWYLLNVNLEHYQSEAHLETRIRDITIMDMKMILMAQFRNKTIDDATIELQGVFGHDNVSQEDDWIDAKSVKFEYKDGILSNIY